jgi:hypothetical protein
LARRFGTVRIRVMGTSMLPSIWPGDTVIVDRRVACKVKPGEIALFTREDRLFAHRVVENRGSTLITRGDSHSKNDPPVAEHALLGVVTAIERGGKQFQPETHLTRSRRVLGKILTSSVLSRRFVPRLMTAWHA